MPARIPLYVRILGWFFLNVAVLGGGVWLALRSARTGEWFVMQQAEPQLQSISRLLLQELQPLPQEKWDGVLLRFGEAHHMSFAIFGPFARQIAGTTLELPPQIRVHLNTRPPPEGQHRPGQPFRQDDQPPDSLPDEFRGPPEGFPPEQQPGPPGQDGPPLNGQQQEGPPGEFRRPAGPPQGQPQGQPRPDGPFVPIVQHSANPEAWWFIIRVPLRSPPGPGGLSLVMRTENLAKAGLLMDFKPWLWSAAGLLVVSALLWIPFVRGITRTVGGMKKATARIAEGAFDVTAPDTRRDELGELATGINRMAARLSGFVTGQKRFLGDIAHELCTPLARMQMSAAALEQRAPQELQPRLADLTAEVEDMSRLVSELLDFSRAGLAPQSVALADTPLLPLTEQVLAREAVPAERFTLCVPPDLSARANAGLLTRALGNLVRNSLRYAGPQSGIEITAAPDAGEVVITVSDNGPGVPPDALPSLFDPFFRLQSARDRASGGTGLGLAIVRTCVESCRGTVTAGNRPGGGLQVIIRLQGCGN